MARQQGLRKQRSDVNSIYRMVSDSVIAAAAVAVEKPSSRFSRSSIDVTKCECCGLGEECTGAYVKRVQQQFLGHFVCGLCAEAVKEEQARLSSRAPKADDGDNDGKISDAAIRVHMNICRQFNCAVRENPVAAATSAMRQLLVRRGGGGTPRIQKPANMFSKSALSRSTSCIPALAASQAEFEM